MNGQPAPGQDEWYWQLFEANPGVAWLLDPATGAIVDANPAAAEFWGYSRTELRTMNLGQLDGRPAAQLLEALAPRSAVDTATHRLRDGQSRTLEVFTTPMQLAGRQLTVCFGRDITGRQLAHEEALREAEWKFRALFEKGPIGVAYHQMIYDEAGAPFDYRFLDANECYLRLTGVDPRGKTVREAFAGIEHDPFDWIATFGAVARTGVPKRFEQYLALNHRWYDCAAYQYRPDCFVVAFLDITERKLIEQALHESEIKFRSLVEHLGDGIGIVDLEDRFIFANRAGEDIFGVNHDGLAGRSLRDFVTRESFEALSKNVRQRAIGAASKYELDVRRDDGSLRTLFVTATTRADPEGRAIGSFGVFRDVTESRAAELELRRAMDVAHAANDAKNLFLANISHEMRTPLNGILGMNQLMLSEGGLSATHRAHLMLVHESATRLLAVINDVLEVTSIEAGPVELEQTTFDPRALVEDVAAVVRPSLEQKRLGFAAYIDADVPQSVTGDRARIRHVLLNLLSNAVKFSSAGLIEVRLKRVDCSVGSTVTLRFEVADHGIGIDQTKQAEICEPFAQVDRSATRRYGGTGLGLAIAQRLVVAMKGQLRIDSTLGEGSTFSFELPLAVADGSMRAAALDFSLPQARERLVVLVAEDNPINQRLLRGVLEKLGHEVVVVENGLEAVQAFEARPYDVGLFDLQMPGLDGLEATRAIRQRECAGARRLPIFAVTASVMANDTEQAKAAGMDGFLAKPINLSGCAPCSRA
jgi:PAS domain S-box-containing protein